MDKPLELISHALCPFVQRAEIALHEKGVSFRRTYVDLDNRPPWFREISPLGKVPLLRVGRAVIFDSAVILEYLEDTLAPALHPADPLTRALHRSWIEYASSLLMDNYAFLLAGDAATMLARRDTIRAKLERLEQALADGQSSPYFAGEAFCLVDAAFAPFFTYWRVFERIGDFGVFARTPCVRAWGQALARRPSVRASISPTFEDCALRTLQRRESHLSAMARANLP